MNKTEKEKMLSGEIYNILDPELIADRARVSHLNQRFNSYAAETDRLSIIHQLLGNFGQNSIIAPPFYCSYGKNIYIGDNVYMNWMCTIIDNNEVHIGDRVMIGPVVQIYTAAHPLKAEPRVQGWEVANPIEIENNVWIGGAAIILPGVRIGQNAVVGAGSVVTRDVPENTVVAGNPARVIKEIEQ